jgi:hypothetical protein
VVVVVMMRVVVFRRTDAGKSNFDSTGPNDSILYSCTNASGEKLFDLGDVLEFCSTAEKGGSAKLKVEVGVEREMKRGMRVRRFPRRRRGGCWRG